MSRVIKFRAWIHAENYMLPAITLQEMLNHAAGADVSIVDISGATMMQFTGLTDVNGVEIYEGDIVSVPGLGNAVVKICPHYGVVFENKKYSQPYADGAAENDYPTVIGSIYQNPELVAV